MQVRSVEHNPNGSYKDRHGSKRAMWGDNGAARVPTKEYQEGYDKIFGKKEKSSKKEVKILSESQKKKQQLFPY